MREYNLIFGILIARKLHGHSLCPFPILIAHTPEAPYPSLFIFTNKPKTMPVSSLYIYRERERERERKKERKKEKERNKRVLSGIIGLIRFPSSLCCSE